MTEQNQEVNSSQGCGSGHSGEQPEQAVGATAALATEDAGRAEGKRLTKAWEAAVKVWSVEDCSTAVGAIKAGERMMYAATDLIVHQDTAIEILSRLLQAAETRASAAEAERDAYRQVAINEAWNFNMERAYGREEYQRQLAEMIDGKAAGRMARALNTIPQKD